jgi:molybdate transport system permease protein
VILSVSRQARRVLWSLLVGVLSTAAALGVALPLAALLFTTSLKELVDGLRDPSVLPAIGVSLSTSLCSIALVVGTGTPLAWVLARGRRRVWRILQVVFELPVVIPPAVAGVALLLAFGRRGLLGPWLAPWGLALPFTRAAVVLAQAFVAAPLFLQSATQAFQRLDPSLLTVGRSLGASPARVFFTLALPLSRPALVGGAALSFARALGEFGATLMFAGNMPGRTQTLPLAIYAALETDLRTAQALSVLLLCVALGLLLAVRAGRWR